VDFNRKRCFKTSLRIHFSDLGGIDHQLRFAVGGGKSEAQAERRLERSRSATPTASRRRKRAASAATKSRSRRARAKCVPRGRKEHGQTERALVGADTIGLVCRTIIGRLFIGRLQRRAGRLSEDSCKLQWPQNRKIPAAHRKIIGRFMHGPSLLKEHTLRHVPCPCERGFSIQPAREGHDWRCHTSPAYS